MAATAAPASSIRSNRAPGTTMPGHGIGLATVSRIVSACGGTITVESDVGRGSTFHVCLPLAPCRETAADAAARTSP